MSEKTKRILLIIGFILITIIIAVALYFVFFRAIIAPTVPIAPPVVNIPPAVGLPIIPGVPPPINLAPPALNIPVTLPPETLIPPTFVIPGPIVSPRADGGLTSFQTLETNHVNNPTLSANGRDLVYHDSQTGFIYTITPDGEKQIFSDTPFKNVENITWAPGNQKAVIEYPDGSNIIYDFNKKSTVTMPAHWKDFTFSNDGTQIAFKDMRLDPENRYIAITDTNGSTYRQIERLGDEDKDVIMTWAPNDKYVALFRKGIDGQRSEVLPIGFNGENYRSFRVEGRDLRIVWAPSGNKLLYSVYNSRSNYNPSLWVVNSSPELLSTGRIPLEINTWADKCTFASETIVYCAVPRQLQTGTGFLPNLADNTPDDIYKIDISSGTKELAAQLLFPTTIDKLIISQDGKYIYWLEKNSGQIKKMNL